MTSNRSFRLPSHLLLGISIGMFAVPTLSSVAQVDKSLIVKTPLGRLAGKREGSVRAYLGIPYAAPPVGPLRWHPPVPAAKWKRVRLATEFGYHCMQPKLFADMIFRDPGISEDCLTLNVWTPSNGQASAKDSKAKLPVMVWIYGGGFVTGGSSEPRQDGAQLASNGVVVVSMNYRLGIFGFFAHPDLAAESAQDASGNYGLMDQTSALQWVQRNIAAFGGDPANVTIFGESAGSFSVSAQMASPLAKGLFARAIGESGAAMNSAALPFPERKVAEERDAAFMKEMTAIGTVNLLRAIPAEELMASSLKKNAKGETARFGPDIDGAFLPESVPAIFAAGRQNDVPLLAGWNRDEGGIDKKVTLASFTADVDARFGENAAAVLKAFPAHDDAEAVRAAADLAADRFIAHSTWSWLEAQTKTGKQPVYRYRFDLAAPQDPNHPQGEVAYHSSEIPYVFGDLDLLQGFNWRPEDRTMSKEIQKYWTNFARTGDPNGDGLVKWPRYDAATGWQVMHLLPEPVVKPDTHRDRELLLESIWAR
jgi:para-nitrobenzyl esterase